MAFLQIIIATILWGGSFFFIKLALQDITATSFVFWRFLIGTLSMVPVFLIKPVSITPKMIKQGVPLGILQLGVILLQTLGLNIISASLSAFLTGFYIVFVLIIRFILEKRFPSFMDVMTSLICMLGLALLTHSFDVNHPWSITYTLAGALCMALYIYLLDLYVGSSSIALIFIQMITLVICTGLLLCLPGNDLQLPTQSLTWLAILFCGICCSTLCFWLQNRAQRQLGAFKVSVILMLEPVLGTVFACLVLDEKLSTSSYIGIGMILTSVAVINARLKKI